MLVTVADSGKINAPIVEVFTKSVPPSIKMNANLSVQTGQNTLLNKVVNNQLDISPLKGHSILLAEDNKVNQEITLEILQDAGLITDLAENGAQSIVLATRNEYDMILIVSETVLLPVTQAEYKRATDQLLELLLSEDLSARKYYREQLDDEQLSRIVKAAPLHDIGKVGIPDHILCKLGKLTEDEFAIMRTHTVIGANAIATAIQRVNQADTSIYHRDQTPMTFLEVGLQIVLWHHERWDGHGYPDKLSCTHIPLPARIMALADVYDELISNRVYKKAFPIRKVEEIIISERGKHFDPVIVDVFIQLRNEFEKIARKLSDSIEVAK